MRRVARSRPVDESPGSEEEPEARIRLALEAGDARLATTLALRAYGPEILRYLAALLGDASEAKEAFSLFGERLWQGIASFRGESSLRTWVYRVAWSAASDLRKDGFRLRGRRLRTEEASGLIGPRAGHGTETWLKRERRSAALARVRSALSLEDQCLLQLRVDRGLSFEACARILGEEGAPVPVPTLRKRFERVKARLRDLLDEDA